MSRLRACVFASLGVVTIAAGCGQSQPRVHVSAAQSQVTAWGGHSSVRLRETTVFDLTEDAHGRVLVAGFAYRYGGTRGMLLALRPDGSPDPAFGTKGIALWPLRPTLGWRTVTPLPNGRILIGGNSDFGDPGVGTKLVLAEVDLYGHVVRSFGRNGEVRAPAGSCLNDPLHAAADGTKILVVALRACTLSGADSIELLRLDSDGALDRTFGDNGAVALGDLPLGGRASQVLVDRGRILVALPTDSGGTVRLIRLTQDGSRDTTFAQRGVATARVARATSPFDGVDALFLAKLGRYTVAGCTAAGPFMARFNPGGRPYRYWSASSGEPANVEQFGGAFGSRCVSFAQLRNHKLVAAGTAVARLFPTGLLDPFHPIAVLPQYWPAANVPLHPLLVARTGAVLVATNLAGHDALIGAYHF